MFAHWGFYLPMADVSFCIINSMFPENRVNNILTICIYCINLQNYRFMCRQFLRLIKTLIFINHLKTSFFRFSNFWHKVCVSQASRTAGVASKYYSTENYVANSG